MTWGLGWRSEVLLGSVLREDAQLRRVAQGAVLETVVLGCWRRNTHLSGEWRV